MVTTLRPYYKALTYTLGAIVVTILAYWTDDVYTGAEIAQTVLLGFGTFLVYVAANAPGARYVKFWIGAAVAGLEIIVAAMEAGGDLNRDVWLNVLLAVGMALGVLAVENKPEPAIPPTASEPSVGHLPRAA